MFRESVIMALHALWANKLRSVLTMLGVIIGVAAVIAMVSIGMGVRSKIEQSIASLGSNLLIIMPGSSSSQGVRQSAGSLNTLKIEDAQVIAKQIKGAQFVAPTVSHGFQIIAGNQNWQTSVQGTTPEYMYIRSLTVGSGSFITNNDLLQRNRVAVLGSTVAANLFGDLNPIGSNVRINNFPYKVIGVLDSKGQSGMGQDQDDIVIIPLTTAQERLLGISYVQSIMVQAQDVDSLDQVQDQITELLRQRHKISGNKNDDFTVRNLASIMSTMQETTATMTLFLASVAAISLLVGGIGIMNIMMVSVTERTREIGIRKALGAKFRDIMLQFLIESMVIGIVGGGLGIVLGMSVALVIPMVTSFTTSISTLSIIVSFGFSVAIGLFFGVYPARKAAVMDPIEALRYD